MITRPPWKLKRAHNTSDWEIHGADGYVITSIPYDDDFGRPEQDESNARLIAQVPAMKHILETLFYNRTKIKAEEPFGSVLNKLIDLAESVLNSSEPSRIKPIIGDPESRN